MLVDSRFRQADCEGAILVLHMNRFFKTLLLWLLVAVLPLHAVGATASMSCGPIHQQAMQPAMVAEAHHQHGMGDASAGHHHDHHDAAKMANAAFDMVTADEASSGSQHYSNCGNCAATCIGAAAPPSALNPAPVFDGSELVTVSPAPLVVGTTPGGLERPPKHVSA